MGRREKVMWYHRCLLWEGGVGRILALRSSTVLVVEAVCAKLKWMEVQLLAGAFRHQRGVDETNGAV